MQYKVLKWSGLVEFVQKNRKKNDAVDKLNE
jgi:hypothetical protein